MYKVQEKPDLIITLKNGSTATPIITLKDEYGGVSHIIEDDHCYVLVNGSYDTQFDTVKHWYAEAVEAVKTLPGPKPETGDEEEDKRSKRQLRGLHTMHKLRYESRLKRARSGATGFREDELIILINLWNEVQAKDFDYSRLTTDAKQEVDDAIADEVEEE